MCDAVPLGLTATMSATSSRTTAATTRMTAHWLTTSGPRVVVQRNMAPHSRKPYTYERCLLKVKQLQATASSSRRRRRQIITACAADGHDKHSVSSLATTKGAHVIAGEGEETSNGKSRMAQILVAMDGVGTLS